MSRARTLEEGGCWCDSAALWCHQGPCSLICPLGCFGMLPSLSHYDRAAGKATSAKSVSKHKMDGAGGGGRRGGVKGGWGMGGVLKQLILNHLPKGVQSNWPGLSHELDKARKEKVKI